jgi:hypothetical protein
MLIKEEIKGRDLSGQSFETMGGRFQNCTLEGCTITLKGRSNVFDNCNLKGANFSGKGLMVLTNSVADDIIVESSSLESIHVTCYSGSIVKGRFVDVLVKDRIIGDASDSIWTNCDFNKAYTSAAKWDGADLTTCRNIRDKNNMSGALFTWSPRGFEPFTATLEEYSKWKIKMKEKREERIKELRLQKEREEEERRREVARQIEEERKEKERLEEEVEGLKTKISAIMDELSLLVERLPHDKTLMRRVNSVHSSIPNEDRYGTSLKGTSEFLKDLRATYEKVSELKSNVKDKIEEADRLEQEGMSLVYSTLKELVSESKKSLTTKEVTQLLTRAYELSSILETLTNHPQHAQMVRAQNKVIRHIRSQYSWFAKAQMPRTIWNDFKVEVKDYLKEVGLMKKGSLSRSTKIKIARALCDDLHEEIKSLKDDL